MDLKNSKTIENLAKSFVEECTAGMKYQIIAELALKQGYSVLSNEIKQIAKNETKHAKVFFDYITENGVHVVPFNAEINFFGSDLAEGLNSSVQLENKENTVTYPQYAAIAKQEGFYDIADSFELIGQVEKIHEEKFKTLYQGFLNDSLYKKPKPSLFVCSECGHTNTLTSAWRLCPLCSANQGFVNIDLPRQSNEKD